MKRERLAACDNAHTQPGGFRFAPTLERTVRDELFVGIIAHGRPGERAQPGPRSALVSDRVRFSACGIPPWNAVSFVVYCGALCGLPADAMQRTGDESNRISAVESDWRVS
jgi:hypothetical protein